MKRTKQELLDQVNVLAGESPSDDMLHLLEDIADSMYDGEVVSKVEYDTNDAAWRKKFADRFSGKSTEPEKLDAEDDDANEENKPLTYADLFSPKED